MKNLGKLIRGEGLVLLLVVGLLLPNSALAVDVFVSSFSGGGIYKVDSGTGATTLIATLGYSAEDGVMDSSGISYWGGITTGVKRVDTNTNTILPDVGTNVCGPEGGGIDDSGNIYFNTRSGPCSALGVWKIAGGVAPMAVQVVPTFSSWGEGITLLKTGPYAGHLLATDPLGQRIVRSSPADLAANNPPTTFITLSSYPGDVKQDSAGNIYVTLYGLGIIQKYNPSGGFIGTFASGLSSPIFMEFDGSDNLYTVENGAGRLTKITPGGTQTVLAQINGIIGIAIRAGAAMGSISGMKFDDTNGNGMKDMGELGLGKWQITLTDSGGNTISTTTDGNGDYIFNGLAADTYTVAEFLQAGWIQTAPPGGTYTVTLAAGENVADKDFGNFKLAEVHGMKWEDRNADGMKDAGEPGLEGWEINIKGTDIITGNPVDMTTTTDANGEYWFMGLTAGDYIISENLKAGWIQTAPRMPDTYEVHITTSGMVIRGLDFGNFKLAEVHGMKFNDKNGDGMKDPEEPGLEGWEITIDGLDIITGMPVHMTAMTDPSGNYWFMGLTAGTYTISETQKLGWMQTAPPAPGTHEAQITTSGMVIENLDFGNQRMPPEAECVETVNPSGKNIPTAGANPESGQNPDGFYMLLAMDMLDPNPMIYVKDTGSDALFGPFASGTNIKYTETSSEPVSKTIGGPDSAVDWHIKGNGDALVYAVNDAGIESAKVSCLVPPPPK